jgi:WD40 repeat protein
MIYDTDTESGQRLRLLQGHQNTAECVVFRPNGRWLGTGSHDRTVRIWDAATGELKHVIPAHRHKIHSLAFSPDGPSTANAGKEGRIAFSPVNTGRFLFAKGAIDSLALFTEGGRFSSCRWRFPGIASEDKSRVPTEREPEKIRRLAVSKTRGMCLSSAAPGEKAVGSNNRPATQIQVSESPNA